jgi:hypothetical protein
MSPFSGSKSKQVTNSKQMESVRPSETSVDLHRSRLHGVTHQNIIVQAQARAAESDSSRNVKQIPREQWRLWKEMLTKIKWLVTAELTSYIAPCASVPCHDFVFSVNICHRSFECFQVLKNYLLTHYNLVSPSTDCLLRTGQRMAASLRHWLAEWLITGQNVLWRTVMPYSDFKWARISVGLNQLLLLCTNSSDRYKMENLGFRRISIPMHKGRLEMF